MKINIKEAGCDNGELNELDKVYGRLTGYEFRAASNDITCLQNLKKIHSE
jgi:hypothetical protein